MPKFNFIFFSANPLITFYSKTIFILPLLKVSTLLSQDHIVIFYVIFLAIIYLWIIFPFKILIYFPLQFANKNFGTFQLSCNFSIYLNDLKFEVSLNILEILINLKFFFHSPHLLVHIFWKSFFLLLFNCLTILQ